MITILRHQAVQIKPDSYNGYADDKHGQKEDIGGRWR